MNRHSPSDELSGDKLWNWQIKADLGLSKYGIAICTKYAWNFTAGGLPVYTAAMWVHPLPVQ